MYFFEAVPNSSARAGTTWTADAKFSFLGQSGVVIDQLSRTAMFIGDLAGQPVIAYVIQTTGSTVASTTITYDSVADLWSGQEIITGGTGQFNMWAIEVAYQDPDMDVNGDGRFNELDLPALNARLGSTDEDDLKWDFDGSDDINAFDVDIVQRLVDLELDSGVFGDLDTNSVIDCTLPGNFSSFLGLVLTDSGYRVELDYDLNGVIDSIDQAAYDCNSNNIADTCDIAAGTSTDLNSNGIPDECDDCNGNSIPDVSDIAQGTSGDCDGDYNPDECGPDCNSNGAADVCEILAGTSSDCNNNGVPDDCDVAVGKDCNLNSIPDDCEEDCNTNGIPDDCELHNCCDEEHGAGCNDSMIEACVCDFDPFCCSTDWDSLCVSSVELLECGICTFAEDCNSNAIPDECEVDCNTNGIADDCDITSGTSSDANANGVPDECNPCRDVDVNCDGVVNSLDIATVSAPLNWGETCATAANPRADANRDGTVSAGDYATIQAPLNWRTTSPVPCECLDPVCP